MINAKYKVGDKFRDVEEGDIYITTILDIIKELDSHGDVSYVVKVEHSVFGSQEHYFTCASENVLGREELIED